MADEKHETGARAADKAGSGTDPGAGKDRKTVGDGDAAQNSEKNLKAGLNKPDGPTTEGRIVEDETAVTPEHDDGRQEQAVKVAESLGANVEQVSDKEKADFERDYAEGVRERSVAGTVNSRTDPGNGKVYTDPRIDPRDTNAPDAGLTPEGQRIAS